MPLKSLIKADLVLAKQEIISKKRVLENLAEIVSNRLHCNREEVYDALLGREKLGSTGIGNGIAIPHCRLESANHTAVVIMSLESAIDFDSVDRQAVDLVFALIVPPQECDQHLATLAEIAELAQSPDTLNNFREAQTSEALFEKLTATQ
ncbi:PTS sugar transporter subunit IIA [Marinomonas sp. C1424]|uniref:PTS sugar transporter subunit IIA n=2 Tax=Marinomonas transparens TaxID=2795388 RepID=A0A934JSW7_9GAMM|nr:PTS sugar transporter subunit IIA [Marinomonas transparens]